MQAMILAAGLGKRMGSITDTTPKPLLKLHGQPLIEHLLRSLAANGIDEIVMNVFHLKQQLQDFLRDGSKYGVNILYSEETTLLNTGGGVLNALSLLNKEPFIVVSADIYSEYKFSLLPTKLNGLAHLVLVDNPPFHPQGDFSLVDGIVKADGNNKLTYANIGVYTHEFFADSPGPVFPLNVLMRREINNNKVSGERFAGMWHNIGTPELLAAAEKDIKSA